MSLLWITPTLPAPFSPPPVRGWELVAGLIPPLENTMTKTMDRHRRRAEDPARDTEWMRAAACKGQDTNLWFPVARHGSGYEAEQAQAAKAVCRTCLVRLDCLTWADATGQSWGIFGGLTVTERRAARQGQAS